MALLERIFSGTETRSQPSAIDDYWYGDYGEETASGARINASTALQISAVFACVRVLAESVSSLPCIMYERTATGRQRAGSHPLADLLHYQPNPYQTAIEFWDMLIGHAALRGRAYAEIIPGARGFVDRLMPLHPDRVRTSYRKDGRPDYEYTELNGTKRPIAFEYMFTFSGPMDGISVVAAARESFGLAKATEEHAARMFGQGIQISGVLEHPKRLDEQTSKRIADSFSRAYAGVRNSHKPAVLEEGMKWTALGLTAEDSQFIQSRKFQINDIARWFRVPPHMVGDLERATFCLPASTKIMTVNGPVSIADVSAGDVVWSLNEKEWERRYVTASVMSGIDPILEIKTTNRTLRCNAKHRVLVRRKKQSPKEGTGGYQSIEWVNAYIPAGELSVGDTVVTMGALPDSKYRDIPTRNNVSEGFMEFCGLLLGDGNVFDGSVSIARAETATYMDYYRGVIHREFVAYDGGNGRDNSAVAMKPVLIREGDRQTRFSSVIASKELQKLGLSGTSRTKRVPSWVFQLADDLKLAFIRGYLDADGSVDKNGRVSFSSVNNDLLDDFRHLCISLDVPVTNIYYQKGVTTLPNGKDIDFEHYYFTCSDPGQNRRIGSNDTRYTERLSSGKSFKRKDRKYPRHGGRGFDVTGCSLARITSIDIRDAEPVYDLTVDETHNFIADGIVVHNSNIEHQGIEFVTHTLRPWLVRIEMAIRRDLIIAQGRFYAQFLVDALMRGDTKSRYEAYNVGINSGILAPNEPREWENLNPLEGLDEPLRPMNMTPVSQAAPAAPALPTPPAATTASSRMADLMRVSVARVVNKEARAITRAAGKMTGDEFDAFLSEFYRDHVTFVAEQLCIDHNAAIRLCETSRNEVASVGQTGAADMMESWLSGQRIDDVTQYAITMENRP